MRQYEQFWTVELDWSSMLYLSSSSSDGKKIRFENESMNETCLFQKQDDHDPVPDS